MKFKSYSFNIFIRTILVFIALLVIAFALVKEWYLLAFSVLPIVIWQFVDYYKLHKKAQREIEQFVESIHYRDFSRHFEVENAPAELQAFRNGFNEINNSFKNISKEKETQYLHLKTILEIVDTGILSYEVASGDILWMNESLKNLLQIPYLKTIHSLSKRNQNLHDEITGLSSGDRHVSSIVKDQTTFKVLLSATTFQNDDKTYKLIAFQNINEALDESESQAWQKLLSVMTHEIMNSVAPISSLAETLKKLVRESIESPEHSKEVLSDIETGISTIKKRSEGLLRFTETYRNLSKITKISTSKFLLIELFEHIQQLMQPTLDEKRINLEIILRDPFLSLEADSGLIEQILINLLLNAIDAVKESKEPKIIISAEISAAHKVIIKITDNGVGISKEVIDKIFIPFFSTKKTGNGIGLSLCKQIMMLHKGTIQVQSLDGEGTTFSLGF